MPSTPFVDLPVSTDPTSLANQATDFLQSAFVAQGLTDWQPNAANLEILQIQVLAAMFNEIAVLAAQVPSSIFRTFGTQLCNVPYQVAVAATVDTVWTMVDDSGYTIPANTFASIGGEGFYTTADTVINEGDTTADITMVAVDTGSDYNGLSGTVTLIDGLAFVSSVVTSEESSDGVDAQTDTDYENTLASELTLQAPRPITAADYTTFVLSFTPTPGTDQELVGRSTAIDGFSPDSSNWTCGITDGEATVTISEGPGPFAVPAIGATVSGTGIPSGAYVLDSPAPTTSGFSISANATATHASETLAISSSYYNERTVGIFVTDVNGDVLNSDTMTAIQTWITGGTFAGVVYPGYRELNFVVNVMSPTYVQISIAYTIHCLPNYSSDSVIGVVNAALESYLDPASWGSTLSGALDQTWYSSALGFGTIRYNKLIGVIEACAGVDYVVSATGLYLSTSPGEPDSGTSDLALTGPAPLPLVEYPTFDPSATYATDAQIVYEGSTYYSTSGSSPGVWNSDDWTLISSSPTLDSDGNAISIWGSAV